MKANSGSLRSQDVVVALAIHDLGDTPWTYATLGERLGLPDSHAHAAVQRAVRSHLIEGATRRTRSRNLLEFLEHGVRYAFPVEPGPITRGVPTAASALPLSKLMQRDSAGDLVWPHIEGTMTGQSIVPLYATVPSTALRLPSLHELLALVDALRLGGVRERDLAVKQLRQRLEPRSG